MIHMVDILLSGKKTSKNLLFSNTHTTSKPTKRINVPLLRELAILLRYLT